MPIIYRSPQSKQELHDYFQFRWEQLRKPLGLKKGSEQDTLENTAFHIAAFNNQKIIAVGRLQLEKTFTARIRYMAVEKPFRKQGIGSEILRQLEAIAKKGKVKMCWLLARETAIDFYLRNNYQIKGTAESELEINHQRMEKLL